MYNNMELIDLQRKALYKEASTYLIDKVGYTDNLFSYADVYVDDNKVNSYTGELLAESYLSNEIGEFATAEEVVNYLHDECGIWDGEDLEAVAIHLKWRGDIIQIEGVWYWNM